MLDCASISGGSGKTFAGSGTPVRALLESHRGKSSDKANGPCYKANTFARSCGELGLKHRRTRSYTPRTNGKAERFIKTAINEWAYAYTFQNSDDRTASLPAWTHQYNWHRPHASLNQQPPISRAGLDDNNLLTHHI